jgi:hypothetical protein
MKSWNESKTLWFAILYALLQVAGLFGYADYTPGADVTEWVGIAVAVIVAALRFKTDKAISLSAPKG